MDPVLIDIIKSLGITGFALWILWRMYESSSSRFAEKDQLFTQELRSEREATRAIEKEVRESIMKQLSENTEVLAKVMEHIKAHHQ